MHGILEKQIMNRKANIGIIGLGYVGLPLAIELAKVGFEVTGFEIAAQKVKDINSGKSYIGDISSEIVDSLVREKRLNATTDFKTLNKVDVIITCVPTPLRKSKDPDVSFIVSASEQISKCIRKGQLIILESTTYPGTTRELVLPLLSKNNLKCGRDFFLAFSPERVDPGNKTYNISNTPKVVGGITPKCTAIASLLYSQITNQVHLVSSTEAAEMVKLLENTFRAVNIALVNEVALMCNRLKLDVWEIIDAAGSKPFGFMPFYPGPGIGGHCIPLDPHYLSWKLKTLNFYSRFIELAGETNAKMPEYIVQKIVDNLNCNKKPIKGSKVLIIGVAYKKDVSDVRESPSLDIIKLLIDRQAKISFFDPFVEKINWENTTLRSINNLKNIKNYDAVVIITNHTEINYEHIVKNSRLVIDTRNATKNIKSSKIVKL